MVLIPESDVCCLLHASNSAGCPLFCPFAMLSSYKRRNSSLCSGFARILVDSSLILYEVFQRWYIRG